MTIDRVVVVGGGIGGLSVALALQRRGFEVSVYERANELREIGAGIIMQPNGRKGLVDLGVDGAVADVSSCPTALNACDYATGTMLEAVPNDAIAARYGLDVNVLWNWYGLDKIWEEAYAEVEGVTWISQGSWDPCNFATTRPIRSIKDFQGLRMYMFPTGGQFMQQFGVVPMALPYEDVEMAIQTGVLDGVAWSGITEDYTVGWADVCDYYLTNPISGAWSGGWFVNTEAWEKVPPHLQQLFRTCIDKSHYYRLHWYWWGEAHYRTKGEKLELTTIPDEEWKIIEEAALKFWDEIAAKSERNARVVAILKDYVATMEAAGAHYRY